ncbi:MULTISPECIES: ribosome hibernation-promoting factor, HPF/YfiA family [Fusobacterium]|uniref:ribosome hibernation-promoting factor, HPF/YfiA family n=1 Tax=Fusobacterium TaxID=848 RepID=UPI0014773A29|nr:MULTISPECIES: ribosome-associated translation inhibitor RaiA [Fusobacterium]NME35626.1 ribosome-associated translation inhibitor RaiA [Fusobacterium sp. FSA-380-WT-3A]
MKISINGRHLVVTDPINDYAVKRVEKLDKFFDRISEVVVTLSAVKLKKGPSHTAEMRAHINGTVLKAVSTEGDLYVAIDKATSILEGQIRKYKEKLRDNNDVVSQRVFKFDLATNTVSTEATKQIVKVSMESKPMTLDEAILQMETLGKDFYIFNNEETQQMNVVYKKRDGNYAHVEPTDE